MKLKYLILVGMLCCLASIVIVYGYWSLEGVMFHKIFNTDEIFFQTTQGIYHPGDTVQAKVTICKYRSLTPTIQWSIIDTYIRAYPSRIGKNTINGCVKDRITTIENLSITLPANDVYYFSGAATYQLNPIKKIYIPLKSNSFKVE